MTTGTILFNPFTGRPRHPSDIASDPKGLLIWDGEEPLRAVQPSQGLQSVADALTIEQLNDKVERLMAVQPSQADAQDAARYRWLRMNLDDSIVMHGDVSEAQLMGEEELDAAIDAAMKESK